VVGRLLRAPLAALARRHPVVTLTGPRQSGKTTLCQAAFPRKPYVSLEPLDQRDLARQDPRAFLARYPRGAVIDEVQRAPELLSYIQEAVDRDSRPGQFVLTGSQQLAVRGSVAQTLAGRTALLQLLPLNRPEISRFPAAPDQLWPLVWAGGYPRIYDRRLPADEWLSSYAATYVERDVRQLVNVGDLLAFQTFLRLCAGRVGQLLNLSSLGADAGVTHMTARAWLSVLEATFVAFRLPPLHRNLTKRLVKTPKLYFYDTGLLCWALGIRTADQLDTHPLRGAIFECWAISEIIKHHTHRGRVPRLSFFRDQKGHECDLVLERGDRLIAVEIKSSQTMASDVFPALSRVIDDLRAAETGPVPVTPVVVYAGDQSIRRTAAEQISWRDIDRFDWTGTRRSARTGVGARTRRGRRQSQRR
jgi:predicted AAA+ superfamily ATPase